MYDRRVTTSPSFETDAARLGRFRAVVDAVPGTMSVGELFVGTTEGAAALTTDRHLVFDWELLTRSWSASAMARALRRRERAFRAGRWPTVVLSNHDQPRHASRLAASVGIDDPAQQDAIARAAAVLILTVRGTPFLYYGEELGMGDVAIPSGEGIDRAADRASAEFVWWDRSPARTPMPWTSGAGAGFSTARPWLRLGPDAATRNVAVQRDDPASIWAAYRRVLAVRRSQPSLQDGSLHLVRTGDPRVLAFRRVGSGPEVLVAIAFEADGGETRLPRPILGGRWRPVGGSWLEPSAPIEDGRRLRLRGFEAVILVAESGRERA